jgi:di/tricarboxylate transporter
MALAFLAAIINWRPCSGQQRPWGVLIPRAGRGMQGLPVRGGKIWRDTAEASFMEVFEPNVQMWATYILIGCALVVYAMERTPMEVTSIGVVCALLILFQVFPVLDGDGYNRLSPARLLQGFANPALATVLALLVMGQGMVRAGILDVSAHWVLKLGGGRKWQSVLLTLFAAAAVSAFLNNIPVVVIFIPIMQALASRFRDAPSKLMIPLSYAAVLGGMTTLVGSSTNLLVNSAMFELRVRPFSFFEFTIPGLVMAGTGFLYVFLIAPRLLPRRESLADSLFDGAGKQFIAQFTIAVDSPLVGRRAPGGLFSSLPDMTVRMVQRGEEAILPPFEDFSARPGDVLVVAATRKALTETLVRKAGLLHPDYPRRRPEPKSEGKTKAAAAAAVAADEANPPWKAGSQVVAEVMVAPASRLEGQTLRQVGFHHLTKCVVLGIQRRARMIRSRMTDIRLEAGDVLLVQGVATDVNALKVNRDVVLMEWSAEELPALTHAWPAALIFLAVIGLAASGVVPLVVATLSGAVAMVALGVVSVPQAARAVDPRIVTTIGAALALGVAMQETGGAQFIAQSLVGSLAGASPAMVLSLFFLTVAGLSNVVSTKTAAVLFTPIAIDIAREMGIPPHAFAVAVVFAANCSFASPLGYQTNLLVLGPGHYKFVDFVRAGIPLILLLWLAFTLFVPWWYGFGF